MSGIKRFLKYRFRAVVFLLLSFGSISTLCASTSPSDAPKTNLPFLEFVTFVEPPYTFDEELTKRKGLVSIILEQLMEKAGIEYKVTVMPPKRAELYVKATPNSCVIPIEKSQEREVFYSWVSPVLISRTGLFQLETANPIKLDSLEDARPHRIGSYLGSSIGEYLSSFSYRVDLATKNDANLHKMEAGRIDLWASDTLSAYYLSKQENIRIAGSRLNFFTSLRAIGCHEDLDENALSAMRDALQDMYKTSQMKRILESFKPPNW